MNKRKENKCTPIIEVWSSQADGPMAAILPVRPPEKRELLIHLKCFDEETRKLRQTEKKEKSHNQIVTAH